jgi:glucokinase
MNDWPFPTLLADVGGTQIRFALARGPHAAPELVRVLRTADHPSLTRAAQVYLAQVQAATAGTGSAAPEGTLAPLSAALAVATPVEAAREGPVRLTNTDFVIDGADLMASLGIAALWIVNDFEALAWSLPTLAATELALIGPSAPTLQSTMAVIGPGTGLGCAGLLRNAAGWHAIPGEGGHVTLAGMTDFERDVLAAAAEQMDHVSAEKLLSGIGMPLLYRAVAAVRGSAAASQPLPTPRDITSRAVAGGDALCREVVETFCALLGGYAGNVALTFGASGGVLIGGGIASHIPDLLAASAFRSRFEDKGRFCGYLRRIGTARITREQPALDGLVYALATALPSLPVQRLNPAG